MPRADGRLDPGEPLRISARAWNRAQDAADRVFGLNQPIVSLPNSPSSAPYTWVWARNNGDEDVPRWGDVRITGLAVTPTDTDTDRSTVDFLRMPTLDCRSPAAGESSSCVAVDPIPQGKLARVAVAGAVQVRTAHLDRLESSTAVWRGDDWSLVVLGGAAVRLGTIAATWAKGTTATVTQQYGDGTAIFGNPTFTAVNHFATITASSTKRVACALVGSTWILIAAEC